MPRPRFEKLSEERRRVLLEAASLEFAERGFERASLNRVLNAAGLSKGGFYYYFDDKLDLYATTLLWAFGQLTPHNPEDPQALGADDFWSRIEAFYLGWIHSAQQHPEVIALLKTAVALKPEQRQEPRIAQLHDRLFEIAQQYFLRGHALGVIRSDVPLEPLMSLSLAIGERADQWLLTHWDALSSEDLERLVAAVLAALRRLVEPAKEDR